MNLDRSLSLSPRRHAATVVFWAALVAWWIVRAGSDGLLPGQLGEFDDRIVSDATRAGVDVGARTRLYGWVLAAFVATAIAAAFLLRRLERGLGERASVGLEQSSMAGLLLLCLAGATSIQNDALVLCFVLQVAYIVCSWWTGRGRASAQASDPGALFVLASAASYAMLAATPARTDVFAVGLVTCGLYIVTSRIELRGCARTFDAFMGLLAAACATPLLLVVREELVLVANQRGVHWMSPTLAWSFCVALVIICGLALARSNAAGIRLTPGRALARTALPLLILGLSCLAVWTPTRDPQHEMLEAGNAGLTLQQWYEFGRWPFFQTMNVHGLSDSFMGFLYSCSNGWSGSNWQHWDFVPFVVAGIAVYALLARVTGWAPLAFVLVIASPFVRAIFPHEVAVAVLFLFAAVRTVLLATRSAIAWALLFWLALALWRLDLALAAGVATLGVWLAAHIIERTPRVVWLRLAGTAAVVGGGALLVGLVITLALGFDLAGRAQEFLRIASSDAAFGRARFFTTLDASIGVRLFVMPLLTVVVVTALVAHARTLGAAGRERRWAVLALVFLGMFSLAIFTRGLVRHTFVEHDTTYVTAFQFAVVALSPLVFLAPERRRTAILAFLALHALLPLACDIAPAEAQPMAWRANTLARASIRLRGWTPTPVTDERFERSPVPAKFHARNIEPIASLVDTVLTNDETFVDLSASPMLYVYAHRRSPHWVNHLIVLQGDVLQRRFLRELESERAPLVVLSQEFDLAARDGMIADVEIDRVPLALWHARIFDALMARAEPFTMAGRWVVWSRTNWARAVEWGPPGSAAVEIQLHGSVEARTFDLAADEVITLIVDGRASSVGRLMVRAELHDRAYTDEIVRDVAWPAGTAQKFVDILGEGRPLRVVVQSCSASGALELEQVRVRRVNDPERTSAALRSARVIDTDLGATAALWGKYDEAPRRELLALHASASTPRSIAALGRERFEFVARPRESRSVLIEAALENESGSAATVIVRYGVAELVGGTFLLTLPADRSVTPCVFRPGMQANWHRRPNSWIEIESTGGGLRVHSLRFAADD